MQTCATTINSVYSFSQTSELCYQFINLFTVNLIIVSVSQNTQHEMI